MVTATEIYVETLTTILFSEIASPIDPADSARFARLSARASANWEDITISLKMLGTDLTGVPFWVEFSACMLVRNAVAHGLGQLTRKQHEKKVMEAMKPLGVAVRDGALAIAESHLRSCHRICTQFVVSLDERAPPERSMRRGVADPQGTVGGSS